ncbi:beta-ketoacyl synthase [Parafrankia sp. BMG5.11]|uniref:beta-ketoacyl synthase n=1 Tax=Parafrankia sp. BMG5.11 TaxID=222540 RepID=UPI00103FE00A|nr:beta-ketoacyl synthase [Parafrankia sp. BMG5.11]TCJ31941.1 beta-ketoacyl synthase [Parafrankia sp. BMG5.11]
MTVEMTGPALATPFVAEDDELSFDGEPFDSLRLTATGPTAAPPPTPAPPTPAPPTPAPPTAPQPAAAAAGPAPRIADVVREVRAVVVAAHESALNAQLALTRLTLAGPGRPLAAGSQALVLPPAAAAAGVPAVAAGPVAPDVAPTDPVATEAAFKPLARSGRRELTDADLAALSRGEVAGVFGPAYDQEGVNPDVRLTDPGEAALLTWVADLRLRGGSRTAGSLHAGLRALPGTAAPGSFAGAAGSGSLADALQAAAAQAAKVFALYAGLHLCLADARFVAGPPAEDADGGPRTGARPPAPTVALTADGGGWDGTGGELVLDVTAIDLIPRPWLAVRALVHAGGRLVAEVRDVAVTVRERPGAPVGADHGGAVTAFLGRRTAAGERALLSEFHMAHCARGDQGVGLGPEFAAYRGRRATRLPGGGLRLVDRVMAMDSRRGDLRGGATHVTEYDAAADCWYFTETANASMPNCVYMETSLQAALMLGYYLGATLAEPAEDYSLRNLGGSATVLREVDLRDATIRQHSTLLSTNPMPGTALQDFSYSLAVDGEPFYTGESMFGYFNAPALARQTGLDGGRLEPTWLDALDERERPPIRMIDVAARRADPAAPLCARGHLALLDDVEVVDGGGRFGQGYLRAVRPIDPADWFFARHFYLDPVIPGSLGVEAVIQAMQEWVIDAGHLAGLTRPGFVLPVGVPLQWKYRGQLLPTDGTFTLEVHIKDVSHRPGRVRVTADASLWKPTMRIYELIDVAVELRDEGAPSW